MPVIYPIKIEQLNSLYEVAKLQRQAIAAGLLNRRDISREEINDLIWQGLGDWLLPPQGEAPRSLPEEIAFKQVAFPQPQPAPQTFPGIYDPNAELETDWLWKFLQGSHNRQWEK